MHVVTTGDKNGTVTDGMIEDQVRQHPGPRRPTVCPLCRTDD